MSINNERWRLQWRSLHIMNFWDKITILSLMYILCCSVAQELSKSMQTVYIVSDISPAGTSECGIECSGVLVRENVVLTTASCVALNKTDAKQVELSSDPKGKDTTINCYSSVKGTKYAAVKRFLHTNWDPKSHKNNFALLKTASAISDKFAFTLKGPDLTNVPEMLLLDGFGKLDIDGEYMLNRVKPKTTKPKAGDQNLLRTLNVSHIPCDVLVEDSSKIEPDPFFLDFLCTSENKTEKNPHARTSVENTLCAPDLGGPLYSKDNKNNYLVWALLSHINHLKYPFCAKKCYTMPTAPPPCNEEPDQMNYRYVLINGDISRWVDRTIDRMDQVKMSTTTCATTTKKGTTNAYYDFDMYEDTRQMVSNHKVCTAASVRNTPVARALSCAWAVVVVAAAGR